MPSQTQREPIAADTATILSWLEQGEAELLDVREPEEHAAERVPGARLVPLSTLEPRRLPSGAGRFVLLCRTGRRAQEAGRLLLAAGHSEVYLLPGGLSAWKEGGGATERKAGAPLGLMRQVQIVAGSLTLFGTVLGAALSPWFLLLSGAVGGGLLFAGASGHCGLGLLLARMPWNRTA